MSSRTAFLSKLIGLYCILVALSMVTRKQATVETVTSVLRDAPLLMLLGVITLSAGLALVLAHNVWSGGAAAVVVTLIGWVTVIKGLLFLFLPPGAEFKLFFEGLHYEQLFYVYLSISFLIGAYLTYGGFASAPRHSA